MRYLEVNYNVKDVSEELLTEAKPIVTSGNCLEVLDQRVYWGWDYHISTG